MVIIFSILVRLCLALQLYYNATLLPENIIKDASILGIDTS